jgi:DNA topoisomerase VI subunit B
MAEKMKKESVIAKMDPTLKDKFCTIAQRENRSMNGMLCTIVENYVEIANNPESRKNYNDIILNLENKKSET